MNGTQQTWKQDASNWENCAVIKSHEKNNIKAINKKSVQTNYSCLEFNEEKRVFCSDSKRSRELQDVLIQPKKNGQLEAPH